MRNNPQRIEVSENGKVIGHLEVADFMQYMDRPNRFLSALIEDFNAMKAAASEPTRVKAVLA